MANRAEGIADVYINDQQAQQALKSLADRAADLRGELVKLKAANDKAGFDKTKKELDEVNREMKAYHKSTFNVKKVLDNLAGATYNDLVKTQRQLRKEMKDLRRDNEADNKIWQQKKKHLDDVDKELTKVQKDMRYAGNETKGLGSIVKKVGPMLAATFSIGAITSFVSGVVQVRKEFETYEAVLKNTLGSGSEAQKSLQMIQDFAAKTPFQVSELTGSFVKLANQGFKPTREEMTRLGDLAASTGKGFDQLAEAVIDAQVGEFERLKEFGVRAQKEGDKVTFTFKGVKEQVDFTEKSIQQYLLTLGDKQGVQNSMSAISQTLEGKISNLGDAWDSLLNTLGKLGGGVIMSVVGGIADLVGWTEKLLRQTPEENIRAEMVEVNKLAFELSNANTSTERRAVLIKELKDISPGLVEGLSAENIEMDKLTANLQKYNEQALQRISLALVDEKQAKVMMENEKLNQSRAESFNMIGAAMMKYNEDLALSNKTAEEKFKEFEDQLRASYKEQSAIMKENEVMVGGKYMSSPAYDSAKEKVAEINKLLSNMNNYRQRGIDLEKNGDVLAEYEKQKESLRQILNITDEIVENTDPVKNSVGKVDKTAGRNKYGQTFEEWKLQQELFIEQEKEFWNEVDQNFIIPDEENVDDESEYLISKYKETQDGRLEFLEAYHKAGLISEAEYNDEILKMQQNAADKQVKIEQEKEAAKAMIMNASFDLALTLTKQGSVAHRVIASLQAVVNTYAAATAALAPPPLGAGPILGPAIAAAAIMQGMANVARINAIQFASGKYDVIGASDGRTYRAGYSPYASTGIYGSPTLVGGLGLVGERAPELVVDGPTLSNIQLNAPGIIDAIMAMRVPQYAAGNYGAPAVSPPQGGAGGGAMAAAQDKKTDMMISLLSQLLEESKKPTRARVTYTDIKDVEDEINDIKNSVSK